MQKPGGFHFEDNVIKTAILVDGAFFLKRFPKVYADRDKYDPTVVAKTMYDMACTHLYHRNKRVCELYRLFFYDCPPLTKTVHRPISKKVRNFGKEDVSIFRTQLHDQIKQLRKTALRLGRRDEENAAWQLNPYVLKELLQGKRQFSQLTDDDFMYYAKQKVVDMKIGLDIAAVAHQQLVDQIVLIAGDSDFVPAAKLARRSGIDFILDPMWNHINPELNEHIDGLRSTCPNPEKRTAGASVQPAANAGGSDTTAVAGPADATPAEPAVAANSDIVVPTDQAATEPSSPTA